MSKRLSVTELSEVLARLHRDYRVAVNNVGNLAVFGHVGEYVGYIDFTYGTYQPSDPTTEKP